MIFFAVAVLDDVTQHGSPPVGAIRRRPRKLEGWHMQCIWRLSMTESFFHINDTPIPGDEYLMCRGSFVFFESFSNMGPLRGFCFKHCFSLFFHRLLLLLFFCPMKWDDLALNYNTLQIIQRSSDCTDTERDTYLLLFLLGDVGEERCDPLYHWQHCRRKCLGCRLRLMNFRNSR